MQLAGDLVGRADPASAALLADTLLAPLLALSDHSDLMLRCQAIQVGRPKVFTLRQSQRL